MPLHPTTHGQYCHCHCLSHSPGLIQCTPPPSHVIAFSSSRELHILYLLYYYIALCWHSPKEGSFSAHILKVQSSTVGTSLWQEHEAPVTQHPQSGNRETGTLMLSSASPFTPPGTPAQATGLTIFKVCPLTSTNPI